LRLLSNNKKRREERKVSVYIDVVGLVLCRGGGGVRIVGVHSRSSSNVVVVVI